MNKLVKTLACCAVALVVQSVSALSVSPSGVELGVWTKDYNYAKSYSDEQNIPMVLFYGSEGCSQCKKLKTALDESEVTSWQAQRKLVMVMVHDGDAAGGTARIYSRNIVGSGNLPRVVIRWKRPDGKLIEKGFVGRKGDMTVTKGSLAEQFVASVEKAIVGYGNTSSATLDVTFVVTNMPNSRLEAVPGVTKSVAVPMSRKSKEAAVNYIEISGQKVKIDWAKDETQKVYTYAVAANATVGSSEELVLLSAEDKELSKTAINFVHEPANSIANPYWITEKTTSTLNYGDWTLDYETALEKIKTQGGNIFAVFSGHLWCPDCKKIGNSLFASAEFVKWGRENKVIYVLFDQPRSYDLNVPQLLSYEDYKGVSGASYISRKGVDPNAAAKVMARTRTLSTKTWLAPETTASRLSNPAMLLINKDGNIAARFNECVTVEEYPVAENIHRLNDLLLLANSSEEDNYATTTKLAYEIGTETSGTLQVNDNVDVYAIPGFPAGEVKFEVSGNAKAQNITTASGSYVVVTGPYAKSEASDKDAKAYGANTTFTYTLKSSVILIPQEKGSSFVPNGSAVSMRISEGVAYRLTGFDAASIAENFLPAEEDCWVAKKSGDVTLKVVGEVAYQIWNPGTIAFEKSEETFFEGNLRGKIEVVRKDGASGACTVNVNIVKISDELKKRVRLAATNTLVWADGEMGTKTVSYSIIEDDEYQSDDFFQVALVRDDVAPLSAAIGEPSIYMVKVVDSDKPTLETAYNEIKLFTGFECNLEFPVHNILEDGRVTISKVSGRLPGGVKLTYDEDIQSLILAGTPKSSAKASDYKFTISERREDGTAKGREMTFNIAVVSPADLDSDDENYNPAIGKTITTDVPMVAKMDEGVLLAGTLSVSINKSGSITAKLMSTAKSVVSFKGAWQSLDGGDAYARFETRREEVLELLLSKDGKLFAELSNVDTELGEELMSPAEGVCVVAAKNAYEDYAGYYTVTLPVDTSTLEEGNESIPTGTGYVTLKMTTSAFKKTGKLSYSGKFADGSALSGTTYLVPGAYEDGCARLCIFKRSGKNTIGLVMKIKPAASEDYVEAPMAILGDDEVTPYWNSSSFGILPLEIYGGYYDSKMDLLGCCADVYETETFSFDCDDTFFKESERYGAIEELPEAVVTVKSTSMTVENINAGKVSIKLNKSTGVANGTFMIKFADKSVKATFYGVLLPHWVDCGCSDDSTAIINRPFFSGYAVYSDKVDGKSVKRGFAVNLTPVNEE